VYIFKFFTFFPLRFRELSLVGLALDMVDEPLSFSAVTWLHILTHKVVTEMTCNVSNATLNSTIHHVWEKRDRQYFWHNFEKFKIYSHNFLQGISRR